MESDNLAFWLGFSLGGILQYHKARAKGFFGKDAAIFKVRAVCTTIFQETSAAPIWARVSEAVVRRVKLKIFNTFSASLPMEPSLSDLKISFLRRITSPPLESKF